MRFHRIVGRIKTNHRIGRKQMKNDGTTKVSFSTTNQMPQEIKQSVENIAGENRWSSTNQSKNHRNDNNYVTGQVFNSKQENNLWQSEIVPNANSSESKFQATDTNSKSGITQVEQVGLNATPSLDAAQRKTLPAWIR